MSCVLGLLPILILNKILLTDKKIHVLATVLARIYYMLCWYFLYSLRNVDWRFKYTRFVSYCLSSLYLYQWKHSFIMVHNYCHIRSALLRLFVFSHAVIFTFCLGRIAEMKIASRLHNFPLKLRRCKCYDLYYDQSCES